MIQNQKYIQNPIPYDNRLISNSNFLPINNISHPSINNPNPNHPYGLQQYWQNNKDQTAHSINNTQVNKATNIYSMKSSLINTALNTSNEIYNSNNGKKKQKIQNSPRSSYSSNSNFNPQLIQIANKNNHNNNHIPSNYINNNYITPQDVQIQQSSHQSNNQKIHTYNQYQNTFKSTAYSNNYSSPAKNMIPNTTNLNTSAVFANNSSSLKNSNQNSQFSQQYIPSLLETSSSNGFLFEWISQIIASVKNIQIKITKLNELLLSHQKNQNLHICYESNQGQILINNNLIELIKQNIEQRYEDVRLQLIKVIKEQINEIYNKKYQSSIFKPEYMENKNYNNEILDEMIKIQQNLIKDFDGKIGRIHEASRQAFKQIQLNFVQMRQILQNKLKVLDEDSNIFKSNKKFNESVIMIKYKEFIETNNAFIKGSNNDKNLLINQINYYLDRQGYLITPDGYYLINQKNQQIKLGQKQIHLLNQNGILIS